MKLSVIVPVYQVEATLDRCVASIVGQTFSDLEVILVDDGSSDRSPQLCDEWAAKDSRVRVIHKTNGGLSDARNAGLDVATGDFVTFVDSDDYLEHSGVSRIPILRFQQTVAPYIYQWYLYRSIGLLAQTPCLPTQLCVEQDLQGNTLCRYTFS